jgi:SAM-dependent methyltransferase
MDEGWAEIESGEAHYRGLVAETYDLWFGDPPFEDQAFYERRIAASGEPALEIGCGTGRLLLPYLSEGLDVDGLDASEEMLAICRRKAAAMGLEPTLHHQKMEALDLTRRFRTIYVAYGSFQVLLERAQILATLGRFRVHLTEGGQLLMALFVPRLQHDPELRWHIQRVASRPEDGATILMHEACAYDRTEQVQTGWYRYEVVLDGQVVQTEVRSMRQRWFTKHEITLLLERAGFGAIETFGDYRDEPFDDRHAEMVVRAVP